MHRLPPQGSQLLPLGVGRDARARVNTAWLGGSPTSRSSRPRCSRLGLWPARRRAAVRSSPPARGGRIPRRAGRADLWLRALGRGEGALRSWPTARALGDRRLCAHLVGAGSDGLLTIAGGVAVACAAVLGALGASAGAVWLSHRWSPPDDRDRGARAAGRLDTDRAVGRSSWSSRHSERSAIPSFASPRANSAFNWPSAFTSSWLPSYGNLAGGSTVIRSLRDLAWRGLPPPAAASPGLDYVLVALDRRGLRWRSRSGCGGRRRASRSPCSLTAAFGCAVYVGGGSPWPSALALATASRAPGLTIATASPRSRRGSIERGWRRLVGQVLCGRGIAALSNAHPVHALSTSPCARPGSARRSLASGSATRMSSVRWPSRADDRLSSPYGAARHFLRGMDAEGGRSFGAT